MKRLTLGTIALLGALAVVTVKLPSVLLGPAETGIEGRDGAVAKRDSLVSFQGLKDGLKDVSPLVIKRENPSIPALASLSLPGLATEHAEPQNAWAAKEQPGVSLGEAAEQGTAVEVPGRLRAEEGALDRGADLGRAVLGPDARMGLWMHRPGRATPPPVLVSDLPVPERDSGLSPGLRPGDEPGGGSETGDDATPAEPVGGVDASDRGSSAPVAGAPPQVPAASGGATGGGEARRGFVVLGEAARRHPLWAELAAVEQEIDACKAEWQREVDASGLTEEDIDRCYAAAERLLLASAARGEDDRADGGGAAYAGTLVNRLKEMEARLWDEARRRVEAHAAEVRAKLDDDLYAERARLNQEFDEFKEKTLKEYYLSLFNAQLRLKLLKLPEDERKALQEKLAKLTVEMEMKIDAKAREHDAAFTAYAEKRRAEAEAEIAAFRSKEERSLSEKIAGERAKLEKSLADLLGGTDSSLREETEKWREEAVRRARIELGARQDQIAREFAAKEAAFTERYGKLQARRDALYRAICDDIRAAARELEAGAGMKVSVLEHGAPAPAGAGQAEDVTEKVLEIIRNR